MKITKKLEAEIKQLMDDYWNSYLNGDLEKWASYLHNHYKNIGTTQEEIWNSKKEIVDYTNNVIDQMVGMAEIRNKQTQIIPYDPYIMVHELGDIHIKIDNDWAFYAKLRLSTLLEKTKDGWRVLHQHGSYPDSKTEEGETFAFDKISKENSELREAIRRRTIELEQKNRELEIETSLERVRAVAMSMQKSEDLISICEVSFKEFQKLGFNQIRNALINIPNDDKKYFMDYDFSDFAGGTITKIEYGSHPIVDEYLEKIRSSEDAYFEVVINEDQLAGWKDFRKKSGQQDDPRLDDAKALYYYLFAIEIGDIGISAFKPIDDSQIKILKRFRNVFDLAYRRYNDIAKAEAQAREAQIELALERVRARTMAMHKSDELKEVIRVVYEQFVHLKINVDHAGFVVDYTPKGDWHFWIADEQDIPSKITHPYFESVWANQFNEAKEKGIDFFATNLNFEEKNKFYNELLSYVPGLPEASKDFYLSCPGLAILTALLENVSLYIENFSGTPYTNEENKILRRFGKVFQQTYTRFLDLQRAEAQAREAQIEAALERVRSRSLAMHKSDELNGVVTTIFEKLKELQIEVTSVGIGIIEDSKDLKAYVCGENDDGIILNNYYLPYFEHKIFQDLYRACEQQLEFSICTYSKEEKDSFYKIFFEQATGLKNLPEDIKKMIFDSPSFTLTTVPVNNAVFNINDFEGRVLAESEIDIIKRFARVFDQAYTRFLDLQKAEAQAKESQIQLALERVRARTMAMQRSDELKEVVANMFDGLKSLGVDPTVCNISLIDKKTCDSDVWSAHQTENSLITYRVFISHFEHPFRKKLIDSFLNKISFSVHELSGDLKKSYIQYLIDHVDYSKVPDEVTKSNEKLVNIEEGIVLSAAYMKYGLLIVSRSHAISNDESDILQRFAKIFEQTYTRFLDLQKAEAQAREAQIETALEKVRSRSLAMQKSDELSEVIQVIHNQLVQLGFEISNSGIMLDCRENDDFNLWMADSYETFPVKVYIPYVDHPQFRNYKIAKEQGLELFTNTLTFEEKNEWFRYVYQHIEGVSEATKNIVFSYAGMSTSCVFLKNIALYLLNYAGNLYSETENAILVRFGKVVDQAYTRFLDLQKAEAQAREAQIELALERVRARTMAMHKTDELQEVVRVVAEELKNTGVILDTWGAVICTYFQDSKDVIHWTATDDPAHPSVSYLLPYFKDELFDEAWASKNSGVDYFAKVFSYDVKNAFFNYAFEHSDYRQLPDEYKKNILESKSHGLAWAWSKNSAIMIPSIQGDLPSEEEKEILIRFAKVFEQAFIRFLDLQKAEAQAREAQIETALERVRSRTMAMHSSDELPEAAALLYSELSKLGIAKLASGYTLFDETATIGWNYGVNPIDGKIRTKPVGMYHTETPVMKSIAESWKKQEQFLVIQLNPEQTIAHQTYIAEQTINFPISKEQLLAISPERLVIHTFNFKQGYLLIVGGALLTVEQQSMIIRFAKVFEQTYTRFLDLQRAEAQAREAQIETALERVRARSMAMHSSEELGEVAKVMFDQMKMLGGELFAFGIVLCDKHENMVEQWHSLGEAGMMTPFHVPIDLDYIHRYRYDQWKSGVELFSVEIPADYIARHFELMFELPSVQAVKEDLAAKGMDVVPPPWEIDYGASFRNGYLLVSSLKPFEEEKIFPRFAKVFEQAYTRFLDLQKAEAQAREAQIEVSLEKVRTVALSLKKSDEMLDIAQVLYEQLIELGFTNIRNAIIDIHNDKNETFLDYDYSHDMGRTVTLMSYYDDPIIEKQVRQIESSSDAFFELILEGQELQDLIDVRLKNGEEEDPRLRQIDQLTYNLYSFGNGAIGISNFGLLSDEQKIVLKRFRNVFAFAYKRYTDMVSAETQAREAKKQASLDRIRAEIASMRTSEDLNHITPIIWRELKNLEVPFIRCGVFIVNEETENVQVYLTTPDGKSIAALNLSFDANELTSNTVDYWRKKQVLKEHWNKKEFINWTKSMIELGQVQNAETYQGSSIPPESLDLHFVPFTQGMLYVGDVNPLSDEKLDLVKTLAEAFSIAYARYEDFKNLEEAKNKIEITLKELKSAQVQLIHSEKMASLGELTAGIAHEIKNPLNFVNNFSDLSRELIDDVKEELQKNNTEEVLTILEDLKQNLDKINQHGKRADSIVKGMLLHSRGSSGEKTLTDINDLLDQYVNLAYHGMRAQDKEFNISIEKDYDKTLEKINVVPQDLSRVFLNIINNACYAAYDRKRKSNNNDFSPTLKVSTKNLDGNVQIKIGDNGNGIPANILDKIFQPFFTTKPTGEGTGLGLSLSYDIVTKVHGGELKVETKEGEYTMFTITLSKL